jgi:hypothetical protein
MTNAFRCKRCRQTFIEEEFEKHTYTPTLTGVKNTEFDYYYFTKDQMSREMIMIKGMDGILYGFVKREKKPSDKVPLFPSSNDKFTAT